MDSELCGIYQETSNPALAIVALAAAAVPSISLPNQDGVFWHAYSNLRTTRMHTITRRHSEYQIKSKLA